MAEPIRSQHLALTVGDDVRGGRLDVWLHHSLRQYSRAFLQRLIRDGHVRMQTPNAELRIPKSNSRLHPGDIVEVTIPPPLPSEVAPEDIALDVLYEDDDLIVINKPPGLVMHPGAGRREHTLVNALLHHCRGQLSGIGGVERPGIVHRLDRDTSGCLVAAKTDAAHRGLAVQFASRRVQKTYVALVWGVPQYRRGRIEGDIGRNPQHRSRMAVVSRGGREAATGYEVVKSFDGVALVRCALHTGRTHQIRVHLASIGHPVVGDKVYGRARKHPLAAAVPRQMLHAQALAFEHPRTHKRLAFAAPLPQDMEQLIRRLES